ncbi:hypothetical protein LINGRAHAP2_LOCUS27517 [Linum grandiflorum]
MNYASLGRFSPNVRLIFKRCIELDQTLGNQVGEWSSLNSMDVCTSSDATICSMFAASPMKDPGASTGTY